MRNLLLFAALAVTVGCATTQDSVRRVLVTDVIHPGAERPQVRAWHLDHDWCERRIWDSTDEYQVCDPRPYLNPSTRAMYSLFRYRDGRLSAIALFVPVPCRMTGFCDHLLARTTNQRDQPIIDFKAGLVDDLARVGREGAPETDDRLTMQRRLFDALAVELEARHGQPQSTNRSRTAAVWRTPQGETIGLFLSPSGRWIIETHELPAAAVAAASPPGQ